MGESIICGFIGIDLNPDYCKMAERRLAQQHMEFMEATS